MKKKEMLFVNVYEVTRHYGGPEEGGWYYDWKNCIEVFPVRAENAKTLRDELTDEHGNLAYGDISSVLGGMEIDVRIERAPKQSETKEAPFYE